MPVWMIKLVIALVFGPPLMAGVVLLIGGCWWMQAQEDLQNKEARHAEG